MAHDTEKLRELLERVEKATGPSRYLDAAVHSAFGSSSVRIDRAEPGWVHEEGVGTFKVERVTASLDASIALVERMLPGWQMLWRTDAEKGAFANIAKPGEHEWQHGVDAFNAYASKPPLAILSALLRALISQAEGEAQHG